MTDTPRTIVDLFSDLQGERWADRLESLEGGPLFARVMQRLTAHGGLIGGVGGFRQIAARIPDLLRLDLGVIVIGGWKKAEEIRRYTDRVKYRPEETIVAEVTRHTVTSTHKPTLNIVVNSVEVDSLPFELKLTITIDGALLTIKDGKILAMSPGACKVGGELKCEGYTVVKRESGPAKIPGTWTFKTPIAIPPPAVAARARGKTPTVQGPGGMPSPLPS